jgi:predicted Zn finger-like uncharacterized protein
MFTVCPKCALTLVVTAADLRVAQGYVRCGRCSNVFNALSRLSEDRQAAAAAAQSQASPEAAPKTASTGQQRTDTSGSFRARDPAASTSKARALQAPNPPAAPTQTANTQTSAPAAPAAPKPSAPNPAAEPKRYDDDSIPEEDLEFNPDATDLNKVFVEQPPSPQFTAATGTFKAIRLEAEGAARSEDQLADTDERAASAQEPFDPTDTQVDVEIDPDLLATMAQLSTPAQPVNSTPEPVRSETPAAKARPPPPPPPRPAASPKQPVKQPLLLQPPLEQPPQPAPSMRLAERAKARAEAARTGADPARAVSPKPEPKPKPEVPAPESKPTTEAQRPLSLETTQAIRAALAPRRRPAATDITSATDEKPTSFFAGMWTAGSLVLLSLLLVQIVHHYRHDLATNPTLNGPLTAIYAALGIPIVPRWDLTVYEVRQLGASTAGSSQIRVLASVKNTGHLAQPLPLLRVTLQDRFGNRIASRDVPPQAYLPRAIPGSSLLSAGQRIDAEMTFVDPGTNAVGFEIDACLPAPGGGISCANDLAR